MVCVGCSELSESSLEESRKGEEADLAHNAESGCSFCRFKPGTAYRRCTLVGNDGM